MRPIKLGHEKPVTDIKYNYDGDLLFTSAKTKDGPISVWWSDNGERIGTYDGHEGAVYSLDVNRQSTLLLSGAADRTVRLWDVESGKQLFNFSHNITVRCVAFSEGDHRFLATTDQIMKFAPEINVYKLQEDYREQERSKNPIIQIPGPNPNQKITKAIWGWHNETIISSNSDGTIRMYSVDRGKELQCIQAHKNSIMSIQYDKWRSVFITAGKDGYSKLIDSRTLEIVKEYDTGRPVNAASMSPLMDHVIVGGGEQADNVTRLGTDMSQFKVRFFHSIFGEELGSILGHFGPVNCLTFSPDGRSFASGGEDGYVRLHFMDESYFSRTDEVSKWK